MKKATLLMAVMLLSSPAVMFSQSGDVPPKQAIDITAAEIQTVLKNVPADRGADQQLKIVDMGKYNLAVGVVHRGPSKEKPGEPVSGPSHLIRQRPISSCQARARSSPVGHRSTPNLSPPIARPTRS